jgi:hypothetical protein
VCSTHEIRRLLRKREFPIGDTGRRHTNISLGIYISACFDEPLDNVKAIVISSCHQGREAVIISYVVSLIDVRSKFEQAAHHI